MFIIPGGKGFSKIKRSPAYTFGHLTPTTLAKPVTKANAPLFNIQGLGRSGNYVLLECHMSPSFYNIKRCNFNYATQIKDAWL